MVLTTIQVPNFFDSSNHHHQHFHCCGLLNSDLKQAGFFGYIKVIIFLISTLVFWILCGWLADYSLPYSQVIRLLAYCFSGKLPQKFNHLQIKIKDYTIPSAANNKKQIKELNKLDAQAQICLGILERLNIKNNGSRERVAHTVEALEKKRDEILEELEPSRPTKYRLLAKIQQNIIDSFTPKAAQDYRQFNKIIFEVTEVLRASSFSISTESLTDIISEVISRNAKMISPVRLQTIYNLEELFRDLLLWENRTSINEPNANLASQTNDLLRQRDSLAEALNKAFEENRGRSQEAETMAKRIQSLDETITKLRSELLSSNQEISRFIELNHNKQEQIDSTRKELFDTKNKKLNLQAQIDVLSNQTEKLIQDKSNKEKNINQLVNQIKEIRNQSYGMDSEVSSLRKQLLQVSEERDKLRDQIKNLQDQLNELIEKHFSGSNLFGERRRNLSGRYIGNLRKTQTKYHFSANCPDWWSLVGQYLYGESIGNKKIVSSDSPTVFTRAGLEACRMCK